MSETQLKFAIVSSAPLAATLLSAVCEELRARTSLAIEPMVVRSYERIIESMRAREVHLAWAPPLVAIDLEREAQAKVTLCSQRSGRLDYMSVLFVRSDSPIRSIDHFANKRVAWVAKESSAGYLIPRLKLAAEGHDAATLFAEQSFRRTHEAVARAVLAKEVDIGATYASISPGLDKIASAGWSEAGGRSEDVRVVMSAGPIPSDVIAMSRHLAENQADELVEALQLLGDPVRALINAEKFVPADAHHFDSLRRLVASARATAAADAADSETTNVGLG